MAISGPLQDPEYFQEAKKKVQARSAQAISREEANQDLQGRAGDVSSNNRL